MVLILAAMLLAGTSANAQGADPCQWVSNRLSACSLNSTFNSAQRTVTTKSGVQIVCEDNKGLRGWQRMLDMDVTSVLVFPYPLGKIKLPIVEAQDPGRYRQYDLLKATYGSNEAQVRKNLVDVEFLGQKVPFNRKNGAAIAFKKVSNELEQAASMNAEVKNFLKPWYGGFELDRTKLINFAYGWRNVAGTTLLSAHSFGIAIDLTTGKEPNPVYWLWEETGRRYAKARASGSNQTWEQIKKSIKEQDVEVYLPEKIQTLPQQVVDIFEKYGFVWGAKWNRFDSMHFEYRPEIINTTVDCRWEKP